MNFCNIISKDFLIRMSYRDCIKGEQCIDSIKKNSNYTRIIDVFNQRRNDFDQKLDRVLQVEKQFEQFKNCGRTAFSNIMGGIQYQYGPILISTMGWKQMQANEKFPDLDFDFVDKEVKNQEYSEQYLPLFSGTPSRTFFSRGFLWDDGFHNQIICKFDVYLCLYILDHWQNTTFQNGWIPREQIRGREIEALFKLPVQVDEANPPTIMLPISFVFNLVQNYLIDYNLEDNDFIIKYIGTMYPNLKRHLYWMYNFHLAYDQDDDPSIINDVSSQYNIRSIFRWRSRNTWLERGYYMGSGLDDYPRSDQNYNSKYHLDIHVWIHFFIRKLIPLSQIYDSNQVTNKLLLFQNNIYQNIQQFYDQSEGIFKDVFLEKQKSFLKYEQKTFNPHFGYVNLYPIFFGDTSVSIVSSIINKLKNPALIWSNYGLLSLSKNDEFYGKDDDYWRGPIWININYLTLRGLNKYYKSQSGVKEIIQDLSQGIVQNVCKNFDKTGLFWEQFNPISGAGQKNHPFNGWTSLIVLIMSDYYD